ncbi:hypothetical protein WICMUC_005701 [Wickerhamomyces mucosus]|uniref:serine--tRNA ligase n=1 Tax=Wickerhamomyces mucosus TaxID=1378264 RepID=A0A9P8P6I0_9ASCO|nr:hypothetical protein WICMUC_005701 [Wickerhamomyces mucosus]
MKFSRIFVRTFKTSFNYRHSSTVSNDHLVVLKTPSYDTKNILENFNHKIVTAQKRGLPTNVIDQLYQIPELQLQLQSISRHFNQLLNTKSRLQKELKLLGKNDEKLLSLKSQLKDLKEDETKTKAEIRKIESQLLPLLDLVPNDIDASVEKEEQIIRYLNPKDDYLADQSREHSTIGSNLGIIDLKTASIISGTSWYYLIGDGALLEQALIQYALKLARHHGFKMVIPPSIVRDEVASACGFKPRDQNGEQQVYHLENSKLCLTGTAEIPLAGLGVGKVFKQNELPYRVVGLSRSYRAEAGSRGKDTKGIYRVHEFTKVELFVWATETQSNEELEKLRKFQEDLIGSLNLSARVLNMPHHDLGAPAFKKYDIESWMPGRGSFGEVTSASNCTDYQSRRFQTKYKNKDDGKNYFVHTLNGTAMAVPRVIAAIIENFYDSKLDAIKIPEVLQPFMDDKKYIHKQ